MDRLPAGPVGPVRPSPIPGALRHDGCDHYRPSWARDGARCPPPGIALGVHRRPDYGQSHSCPTTLCTYPTRKAGEVFVAGAEWARAINLTYAPGPVVCCWLATGGQQSPHCLAEGELDSSTVGRTDSVRWGLVGRPLWPWSGCSRRRLCPIGPLL